MVQTIVVIQITTQGWWGGGGGGQHVLPKHMDFLLKALYFYLTDFSLFKNRHTFDQKRLKQPLYRHPWEDVLYTK